MPRRGVAQQRFAASRHRTARPTSSIRRNPNYRTAAVLSNTVTNSGTVATSPTISIAGPLSTPTVYFENATAGKTVWVNRLVGSGETLAVNFATRVVTVNGVEVTGVVSVDSRWWELAPGANTIRSNVALSVSHRNAFV